MASPLIKCDKCRRLFELATRDRVMSQHDFNYAVPDSWLILNGLGMPQDALRKAYDAGRPISVHHLCPDCTKRLKAWIETPDPEVASTL